MPYRDMPTFLQDGDCDLLVQVGLPSGDQIVGVAAQADDAVQLVSHGVQGLAHDAALLAVRSEPATDRVSASVATWESRMRTAAGSERYLR